MSVWRKQKRQFSHQQPSLPGLASPFGPTRRLATPHEYALDVARTRLTAATLIFALSYIVIAGRLADLTLFKEAPDLPLQRAELNEGVTARADIIDRNGIALATSLPTISLCADTKKLLDPDAAAKQLLTVLPDLDKAKLAQDLHSGKHCAMIRRHLTPRQYYDVNKLGIAGLDFQPDERRTYPSGNTAAHLVGYTDIDNRGLGGIESKFNNQLEEQQEPVALSVDLRLQTIMHDELLNSMTQFHAIGATGLIMDIQTGEILAMVSLPDFDPQRPGAATDTARFNRATLGVYEMGSTFKIFNTALALDSGLVHLSDTFDTIHPLEIGHQTIKDFETEKRWLNVAEIFTRSSNIGSARIAERFGGARQRAFLARLGLTQKSPIEMTEVGAPIVPTAKDWSEATTLTAAFGHGIAVNAIQLIGAAATIVNNGVPVHPTLLKVTNPLPANDEHVISPKTSAQVRGLMRLVITRGTAKGNDVQGYLLGGKTGTADKNVNGHYTKTARLSSFLGVFPLNAPRYLVFAMLDEPQGNAKTFGFATGGWVAAPAVSKVVSRIGPLLGMTPLDADAQLAAEKQVLRPLGTEFVEGLPADEVPNYASNETDSVE